MPFYYRKENLKAKVERAACRLAKACVCFVYACLLAFTAAGCQESGREDVFLVDASGADVSLINEAAAELAAADEIAAEMPLANGAIAEETIESETDGPETQALFVVHICGAVKEPGVYELPQGSRIMDAVEAAGGFEEDAAQEARNLAECIVDGSMIRIPTAEEAQEEAAESGRGAVDRSAVVSGQVSANGQTSVSGLVNINTADSQTLQTLPGIGESRAAAIIAYREKYGAFASVEDIMKVSGIKQAAFEKLKDRITV